MRVAVAKIGAVGLFAAGALLLGGATTYRILALYPENREAQAVGPLKAHLDGQDGNGSISLEMPGGEVLKGRFEVKVGGSFGAYGKSRGIDRPGGAYTGPGSPIVKGDPAFVDMKGAAGATVHCELVNDRGKAHGSGVCLFSNGAEYRVLY